MPLTKIVCTLGPATEDEQVLRGMIRAGMTVARLNFSHGDAEEKRATAELVRRIAAEEGRFVALLGDLQGPKIRIGRVPKKGIKLKEGKTVVLTSQEIFDPETEIPFPHPDIVDDVKPGDRLLLDDGTLELEVVTSEPGRLTCKVVIGGKLTSRKGVNLPGVKLHIPAMTEKDKVDALTALELQLDYLALSFVRQARDVDELRVYLQKHCKDPIERQVGEDPNVIPAIVAKIEKPEALDELEAIVTATDAVMVARGDLGVETSPEQVPLVQKRLIHICNRMGKPVITATQMLQSMIDLPRPTRAEASDVANAILDGSDAVMLSGETSVGKYPVESVAMMATIAETVETSDEFPYHQMMDMGHDADLSNAVMITRSISHATVQLSQSIKAKAITTSTESGRTARMVARHRPQAPLLAVTPFESTARRMQLIWGVAPVIVPAFHNTDEMIRTLIQSVVKTHSAEVGDNVVMTAGIPLEVHGVTNMVKIHTVREEDLNL